MSTTARDGRPGRTGSSRRGPLMVGLLVAATLALLVALAVANAGPAQAGLARPAAAPVAAPTGVAFTWMWNDGSRSDTRSFVQDTYQFRNRLPNLVVTTVPATAHVAVYLQFFQDGWWNIESVVATNSRGVAKLQVDPICRNGTWCDGQYQYRLKIGPTTVPLTIAFSEH